jgi:Domain of unknown function (DUF4259)
MGVWGIGPFDNDDAADFVAKMVAPVKRVAEGKGGDGDYYLARACGKFLLVAHATDILGGPSLAPVLRALARMRTDREWLASWRDPRQVAGALDREILAVQSKMALCLGCRHTISRSATRELALLAEAARGAPVPRSARSKRRSRRATKAAVSKLLKAKAPRSKR